MKYWKIINEILEVSRLWHDDYEKQKKLYAQLRYVPLHTKLRKNQLMRCLSVKIHATNTLPIWMQILALEKLYKRG